MKAADTNIIVRYLVRDDPRQALIADEVMTGPVLIPHTILQETAWVLLNSYAFDRATLAFTLETLLDLQNVTVEHERLVRWAIERTVVGADFADMLHIASASSADAFVTFDRAISRKAGPDTPVPIETLKA